MINDQIYFDKLYLFYLLTAYAKNRISIQFKFITIVQVTTINFGCLLMNELYCTALFDEYNIIYIVIIKN